MDEKSFIYAPPSEEQAGQIIPSESLQRFPEAQTKEELLVNIIDISKAHEEPRDTLKRIASYQSEAAVTQTSTPESNTTDTMRSDTSSPETVVPTSIPAVEVPLALANPGTETEAPPPQPLVERIDHDPDYYLTVKKLSDETINRIKILPKFEGVDPLIVEARLGQEPGISIQSDGSLLAFVDPRQVRQEFARSNPKKYADYVNQERPQIYGLPQDDPAYRDLGYTLENIQKKFKPIDIGHEYGGYTSQDDIVNHGDESRKAYEQFAATYPEKAAIYWKTDPKLAEVLAKKEGEVEKIYTNKDGQPDWREDPLFHEVTNRRFGGDTSEGSQLAAFAYFHPVKAALYAEQVPALQEGLKRRESYLQAEAVRQNAINEALRTNREKYNQEYDQQRTTPPVRPPQEGSPHAVTTSLEAPTQKEQISTVEQVSYVRSAPTLDETLASGERLNLLSGEVGHAQFTERQGLLNLRSFLDTAIQVSRQNENKLVLQKAEALRNKLTYIGEQELQEAVLGMAKSFVESAGAGKDTWIFLPGSRSEQYLTVQVLKAVDNLTDGKPEVRKHIKFSKNPYKITECFKANSTLVSDLAILDDFVLSGSRIRGAAEKLVNHFTSEGYKAEDIAKYIHVYAVASRKVEDPNRFSIQQGEQKIPINFQSYFGVESALDDEGKPLFFGSELVTGSHASTDYTFENPLDELRVFMSQNGHDTSHLTLPEHLKRPYEKNSLHSEKPNDFADPEYQADWEMIQQKYELT